jgi:hypothetical protein
VPPNILKDALLRGKLRLGEPLRLAIQIRDPAYLTGNREAIQGTVWQVRMSHPCAKQAMGTFLLAKERIFFRG